MRKKIFYALILVVALPTLVMQCQYYSDLRDKERAAARIERKKEMHARSLELWPDSILEKALPAILAEKRVIGATWKREQREFRVLPKLVVTMQNNGSNKTGFAEYLCMVLTDYGIKGTIVDIQDVDNQPATMGFTDCPR